MPTCISILPEQMAQYDFVRMSLRLPDTKKWEFSNSHCEMHLIIPHSIPKDFRISHNSRGEKRGWELGRGISIKHIVSKHYRKSIVLSRHVFHGENILGFLAGEPLLKYSSLSSLEVGGWYKHLQVLALQWVETCGAASILAPQRRLSHFWRTYPHDYFFSSCSVFLLVTWVFSVVWGFHSYNVSFLHLLLYDSY